MSISGKFTGLCAAGALLAAMGGTAAHADSVADFYKNHRVTMYIGYSAGGGYDRYARTIARHMGDHIPGHPQFISKNATGAGSMRLANEIYNVLPQDGTAIATVSRGIPAEKMQGNPLAHYNPRKFNWIGSANNETSTCVVWHTTKIKTLQDFLNDKILVGGTGPSADTDVFPRVLNNVIGTKLKVVTGYPGGNDINLAMERGEVQGRCGWSWSSVKATRPKWLKENKIRVLLAMSVKRNPELKDVPFVMDLAKTDRDRKILQVIFGRQAIGRPFVAGPKVPADRVKALRVAFMATMKDPKFLKDAHQAKLEINPISGEEAQKVVDDMFNNPPALIAAANAAATNTSHTEITKAVIPVVKLSGKITGVKRKGKRVAWAGNVKKGKLHVGKKTKITIGGKMAKASALRKGMACDFTVKGVETALKISCN